MLVAAEETLFPQHPSLIAHLAFGPCLEGVVLHPPGSAVMAGAQSY